MIIFAMSLEMTADIARKQLCLVLSENLDNSKYTRMTAQVVYPNVYSFIHPALVGWVYTYTFWRRPTAYFLYTDSPELSAKERNGSHLFMP